MEKIRWKGGALLAPLPAVLVTCGTMEHPNVLTVGWTGIVSTDPPRTYISVRPERFSHGLIREGMEFAVNLTTEELARAVDFCGVRSGRDTDKFGLTGLTPQKAFNVGCPVIAQSPISLECRVFQILPLGSHDMFLADILCVDVSPQWLGPDGRLRLDKCRLLAYAHGSYFGLGRRLGGFGFSVRRKPGPTRDRHPR